MTKITMRSVATDMIRRTVMAVTMLVFLSFILMAGSSCGGHQDMTETGQLEAVEIREYQGERLSSKDDFRENSIRGPQNVDLEDYNLKISGLITSPQEYEYDYIIENYKKYEKVVTLDCVEGWSATILWEGPLVRDLLAESGILDSALVVIFHAYDGYTTSFPIEYIMNNDIILAHKMNGVTLPPERGYPFALVAESKWGYKWIKWVTEIELSDDVDYKGYWESRGYSNSADIDESFFD